MKLFDDWQQNLLRPVLVSVLTAGILFTLAWPLKPLWLKLFEAPPKIREYPLFCTAEAYNGKAPTELHIEVFIVNRTEEDYTRDRLAELLKVFKPEQPPSPDLTFTLSRKGERVRIETVENDLSFNDGKGELDYEKEARRVRVRITRIESRAILRLNITVVDLPLLGQVTRSAKASVPFKERYDDGCYTR